MLWLFVFKFFSLKELWNCVSVVNRVWSSFYPLQVYLSLHFLPFFWKTAFFVFMSFHFFYFFYVLNLMSSLKVPHVLCDLSRFHRLKNVRIRSYSGRHFPTFGLNTGRYSVSLRIQYECGKMQTRITPNTDTFYAVY